MYAVRLLHSRQSICRAFGRAYSAQFRELQLSDGLVERLKKQGFEFATEVQRKSIPLALEGKTLVINAETGSGKTLCFLLPLLSSLEKLATIPVPYCVVLVPTPDLAHQVNSVFGSLSNHTWGSAVVHSKSRLALKPDTHLVVGVPSALAQYDIQKVLRGVRLVGVDEADTLLTGSESKVTWDILRTMRELHRADVRGGRGRTPVPEGVGRLDCAEVEGEGLPMRQLIFTAATLPSGGPQTIHSVLSAWLPKEAVFVTTGQTHHPVETAKLEFVKVKGVGTPREASDHGAQAGGADKLSRQKANLLVADLDKLWTGEEEGNGAKVLVFVNTLSSAKALYTFLTGAHRHAQHSAELGRWWHGKVGQLNKEVEPGEREVVVREFNEGKLKVLVCTDLASRGLDFPDVTAVVQFDFPVNSADYLHRAGRTARAGKAGRVVAYVEEADADLAHEIQCVLGDSTKSFDQIFSRNKMLRRKINAKKARSIE